MTTRACGKVLAAAAALLSSGCWGASAVELVGVLERKTIELAAPTSEVIVETPVPVGSRVEAGDIVLRLDTTVADAELKAHEAARAAAEAQLKVAEREFQRVQGLQKARVASGTQFDRARQQRDEASALIAERDARLAQARKRLEDLTIRSHTAGTLDQLPFEAGERVPAGGVVAVVLAADAPWVRVWLPSRVVTRVGAGSRAEVRVDGLDKTLIAHVQHVGREPEFTPHYALTERESAHLVFETRITLDDALVDLRPGLAARVRLFLRPVGDS